MNQQERSSLLQSIGKYIKAQFAGFERRLELAEQKAAQALALDVDARIKLATIEAVKSATESMRAELAQAKQEAAEATQRANDLAASLRQPEDGKSVTVDDVLPVIEDLVSRRVAEIPVPTGPDPEVIRGMVQEAVEALPRPTDGKYADPAQIERAVADAVAKIPAPQDGKSVTLDDVMPTLNLAMEEIRDQVDRRLKEVHDAIESAQQAAKQADEKAKSLRQPEDGKSVTMDDVRPVIEEAVQRAVDALPPPKDGKSVTLDDVRPLVDEAVKSAVAAIEVPEPRDGEDGRDALQLEILPIIDPDKSYPRGSYAKHLGGLWRAYEQTHEMRGWECIVEGIATLSVEQIDERTFVIDCGLSSGRAVRKEVAVPMVIDRGVYRADGEYRAGDGVTWAGSYWIAKDDTPQGKPGEPGSDGWRLAVKRGRDGKDGRNGIDKTAPVRIGSNPMPPIDAKPTPPANPPRAAK